VHISVVVLILESCDVGSSAGYGQVQPG